MKTYNETSQKSIKKKLELAKTKRDKEKYFEYYDDVKDRTHKIIDW